MSRFSWLGMFGLGLFFVLACETSVSLPHGERSGSKEGQTETAAVEHDAARPEPPTEAEVPPSEALQEAKAEALPEGPPDAPSFCKGQGSCSSGSMLPPACPKFKLYPDARVLGIRGSLVLASSRHFGEVSLIDLETCQNTRQKLSTDLTALGEMSEAFLLLQTTERSEGTPASSRLSFFRKSEEAFLDLPGWLYLPSPWGWPTRSRGFLSFSNEAPGKPTSATIVFYEESQRQLVAWQRPGRWEILKIVYGDQIDLLALRGEKQNFLLVAWQVSPGAVLGVLETQVDPGYLEHFVTPTHVFWTTQRFEEGKMQHRVFSWAFSEATAQERLRLPRETSAPSPRFLSNGSDVLFWRDETATLFPAGGGASISFDLTAVLPKTLSQSAVFIGSSLYLSEESVGFHKITLEKPTQRVSSRLLSPIDLLPKETLSFLGYDRGFPSPDRSPRGPDYGLFRRYLPGGVKGFLVFSFKQDKFLPTLEGPFLEPALMGRSTEEWRFYSSSLSYFADDGKVLEHSAHRLSDGKRFWRGTVPFLENVGLPRNLRRLEVIQKRHDPDPPSWVILDHRCFRAEELSLPKPAQPFRSAEIHPSDSNLVVLEKTDLVEASLTSFRVCP